jgi:hypothetical protein
MFSLEACARSTVFRSVTAAVDVQAEIAADPSKTSATKPKDGLPGLDCLAFIATIPCFTNQRVAGNGLRTIFRDTSKGGGVHTPRLAATSGKRRKLDGSTCRTRRRGGSGRTGPTRHKTFTLGALARQLASAADSLGLFARALFRRLLIVTAHLHFTEDAFALHLLLESAERLINIVIADEYLHWLSCVSGVKVKKPG